MVVLRGAGGRARCSWCWRPTGRATAVAAVYAAALAGLLGTSALYHRVTWRPAVRAWMRRLDHSMIFVLIAGTYTPFAAARAHAARRQVVVLAGVWAGAAAGVVFCAGVGAGAQLAGAVAYVALGWFACVASPQIVERAGVGGARADPGRRRWPTPPARWSTRCSAPIRVPAVFGYHEVFHVLVVVAAVTHFVAVAAFALPAAA